MVGQLGVPAVAVEDPPGEVRRVPRPELQEPCSSSEVCLHEESDLGVVRRPVAPLEHLGHGVEYL